MKTPAPTAGQLRDAFARIKRATRDGLEHWSARALARFLEDCPPAPEVSA